MDYHYIIYCRFCILGLLYCISILVLMDYHYIIYCRFCILGLLYCISILVLMEIFLDNDWYTSSQSVLILVLADMYLKHILPYVIQRNFGCFNPYSGRSFSFVSISATVPNPIDLAFPILR
jgi:hypothetical protein